MQLFEGRWMLDVCMCIRVRACFINESTLLLNPQDTTRLFEQGSGKKTLLHTVYCIKNNNTTEM